MDPLFKVENSTILDARTKKSIAAKTKNIVEGVSKVELASGVKYPPYYVEPVLTVVPSTGNVTGLGVLYARTIPLQDGQGVTIVVELSAPLLLYGTKVTVRIVLGHELLHYIELIRNFTRFDITSELTSSSMFEESYADSIRAVNPMLVYKDKKFARALAKKTVGGFDDPRLNEKTRINWIEKGKPTVKLPIGANQIQVPVEAIVRSQFDPKVKEIVSTLPPN